ncbi:MAG: hypothetical protein ACREL6_02490 [Gemmatimonadales bacterium]
MTEPELYRLLLRPIHETGIEYMVTGAVAGIVYGEPRLTNDVDLVARLDAGDAGRLHGRFSDSAYYVPPMEAIEQERLRPRFGHFNIIHHDTGLRADIYLAGDDPLHSWAFTRRITESMGSGAVRFAPIEYVVVRKLEYYRQSGSDRHLRDIAGMVRISGDSIDMEMLGGLLIERDLTELWDRARKLARE